jgi:lysophospholipase L1-like esterase
LPPHLSRQAALAQPGRREFQLLLQALQRLHSIATQDGAQTVIVLQPGKEMVYLPLLGETVPDPASALREALEKLGIDYLDLTPGFRDRAAAGEKLFFEYDGHPNAAGYALIAQLVLSHLKQNGRQYALSAGN